jgi:hypothetical protein
MRRETAEARKRVVDNIRQPKILQQHVRLGAPPVGIPETATKRRETLPIVQHATGAKTDGAQHKLFPTALLQPPVLR